MDTTPPLLLPIGFLVEGGFWWVLIKCLFVCPILPILLDLVFGSRLVPLNPKYQFWAFFPGNPCLAIYIALCSTAQGSPRPNGFWQSAGLDQVLLVGAIIIYVMLNIMDLKSNYTVEQMSSPFKVWHNLLYLWYGYLAFHMTLVLLASTDPLWVKLVKMTPGLAWFACLVKDSAFTSEEELKIKFQTAHVPWNPIWKTKHLLTLHNSANGTYCYY